MRDCLCELTNRVEPDAELVALAESPATTNESADATYVVRTDIRSANHGNEAGRPQRMVSPPLGIMLHHTAGSKDGDLATLTRSGTWVSSNDYITKEPQIFELVPHPLRAWHAGTGDAGTGYASDGNTAYWGIEIENLGNGRDPYPARQIDAIVWRCRQLRKRWGLTSPNQLFRHRDFAPSRKTDPSDNFPFAEVRRRVFAVSDPTDPQKPVGTLHVVAVPAQQVAAFKVAQSAGHLAASFEALGLKPMIVVEGGLNKVRLPKQQQGAYADKGHADAVALRLQKLGAKVERSTKAGSAPAAKKPAPPASRSLVPAGHRDVPANPNGTWIQRHPTRYKWLPGIEDLIRELYRRFPGILVSSYVDHPEGWGRKLGKNLDVRSLDVWDDGGRGVPINPATGTRIVNFLMNEPSPNMIDWIIWQGRIWTRASGVWRPFEDDGTGSHHDHPHCTYVG